MARRPPRSQTFAQVLAQRFPNLRQGRYWFTSCADPYNCVGWVLGDDTQWWEAERLFGYWPAGIPTDGTPAAYQVLFESRGYQLCADAELEAGFEKLAIYINDKGWFRHVAWQHESGKWLSKLGEWFDLEHDTPQALENSDPIDGYGQATIFMKRPRRHTRACPQ